MKKIDLGKSGLKTAPVVLGGNVFGWNVDEAASFEILDRFLEMGFNTIDTANSYSHWVPGNEGGESERIIGNWMKSRGNRSQVTIITKVGSAKGGPRPNVSEKHILEEAEKSLKRLQIEQIDLYLTHNDHEETPVDETLGAYEKLISQGKVKYIGASNMSPERLKESLEASEKNGLPRYQVLQPEYNLYDREGYEKQYEQICQQYQLGVIPYYALASGFLTGKYRSEADFGKSAARGGAMKNYLNPRGLKILDALDKVAKKYEVSQAGVALSWLLHQPSITAPIASATKTSHFTAFEEAARLELDQEDIDLLSEASSY